MTPADVIRVRSKAGSGTLRQMDAALAAAKQEVQRLEALTRAPPRPTDAAGAMLASEIRARLASLKDGQRRAALSAALADGDDAVLGAVLNGPPMLSGLGSSEEMEMLRERWRRERHGADVDRIERIGRAVEDTNRAGTLVISFTSRLSSSEVVEKAEASQRAVVEAIRS
ncbi:hypothetical protein [Mesorhizobium sp.]|uniref:hypothetical protein n=1 Tax=Mesorhizobium sp. TaxID=1871066 RepID=UPI000FE766C6|nr:hypothetical protein [Mesorhizobium sp.]RWN59726.1 MAG: hypothetical protein EOS00_17290 [Mesorhizobium sp.]